MGPLHTPAAVEEYQEAVAAITAEGGEVLCGGSVLEGEGNFVQPCIMATPKVNIEY